MSGGTSLGLLSPKAAQAITEEAHRLAAEDPEGALEDAQRAFQTGKEETRRARRHRKLAQMSMFRAKALQRDLEAMGITVVFEPGPQQQALREQQQSHKSLSSQGEPSNGHNRQEAAP